ncbi:Rrf2 family transcriptional regulator [Halothiobacillus sp. DCM-1]|uniref:Rrf2 family transcriptional regulator n=1 Tax=Halothiobacillus sp. DCM-1 TaxID=3112558 RepID=UPI003246686C
MRLTTKCRHAVTALIHLANRSSEEQTISLSEISAIQGVSLSYLEQLFAKMRQADLVIGTRGPGGGYRLNMAADEISIADILDAIDDRCRDDRLQHFEKACPDKRNFAQNKWNEFSRDLYLYLSGIHLSHFTDPGSSKREYAHASTQRRAYEPLSSL